MSCLRALACVSMTGSIWVGAKSVFDSATRETLSVCPKQGTAYLAVFSEGASAVSFFLNFKAAELMQ